MAFNRGVIEHFPKMAATPYEDYTAGEVYELLAVCRGRWMEIEGKPVQWHTLLHAGSYWGRGEPRFVDEFVVGYTRDAVRNGGVVSWDVPVGPDGRIPGSFVRQMGLIKAK